MNSKMENSEKEKIDTGEVTMKKEVVEEVTKTDTERPDGKVETEREVDVEEVLSAKVESGMKTRETVATEEATETKEEVVATSGGTNVEEEAEKATLFSDQALVTDGVSEGASDVAAEKTEEVAAVSGLAPKKLEEAALPTSGTNVGKSPGVADSVPNENLASNGCGGNQETSEIPRSTENQQFVAATPRTRTSWTNCCGLLDLLKRSNQ